MSKLVKKLITVKRGGKTFKQQRLVNPDKDKKALEQPKAKTSLSKVAKPKFPHPEYFDKIGDTRANIEEAKNPATLPSRLRELAVLDHKIDNETAPKAQGRYLHDVRSHVLSNPNAPLDLMNDVLTRSKDIHGSGPNSLYHEHIKHVSENPAMFLHQLEDPNLEKLSGKHLEHLALSTRDPAMMNIAIGRISDQDNSDIWASKFVRAPEPEYALAAFNNSPYNTDELLGNRSLTDQHVDEAVRKNVGKIVTDYVSNVPSLLESPRLSKQTKDELARGADATLEEQKADPHAKDSADIWFNLTRIQSYIDKYTKKKRRFK